jgi:hypothetical protein
MKLWPIALLILVSVLAVPASADSTYTWNFATAPNASLGTNTHTYYSNGIGIDATGIYVHRDGHGSRKLR